MQSGLRMKEELWRLLSSSNCYWLLAKHLVPVSPTSITSELLSEAWKICLHMFSLSSRPPNSVFQAWGEATKSMKLSVTFSIDWFWVWKLDNVLLLQVLFQEFLIFCWGKCRKRIACAIAAEGNKNNFKRQCKEKKGVVLQDCSLVLFQSSQILLKISTVFFI